MNGRAWRYALPPDLQGKLSINLLEFIASAITIHLSIQHTNAPSKVLAYTDSSSALGWLYKASFSSSQPMHDKVARWLALDLIKHKSALYSQHIRGKHNIMADILSRDTHIPDNQLIRLLSTIAPHVQMPTNLTLHPLPTEIKSWLASMSRLSTNMKPLPRTPGKSTLGALIGGADSSQTWASKMNGLRTSLQNSAPTSCPLLQAAVDEINTAKQRNLASVGIPLKPPSSMYVRPSGRLSAVTPL